MQLRKNWIVKNQYLAYFYEKDTDYIYVDKYESAARQLLSKYSTSYLTASLDQIDQLNAQIAMAKPNRQTIQWESC